VSLKTNRKNIKTTNLKKYYFMLQNKTKVRKLFSHSLMLFGMGMALTAQAQDRPQPKFWFGASAAGNFNFYTGTTQTLNSTTKAPAAFHKGFGVRPYGSLLVEYRPHPVWGLMFNVAYDGRGGSFHKAVTPCNCDESLKTNVSYLTFEPSLRMAPFKNGFYLFLGGAYSINLTNSFTYKQANRPDVKGNFSDTRGSMFSTQIGAGYDIPLSSATNTTQVNLSPFISYHPYFGQDVRNVESWSLNTLRVGVALKFGKGKSPKPVEELTPTAAAEVPILFSVRAPLMVPLKRKIKETFPLRNYVFFDKSSSEIPNRYVKLNKEQAASFKSAQLQEPDPKDMSGRSHRQLSVYHNVLNILADRMKENPTTTVTLVGSSAGKGPVLGKEYAESAKRYLVNVFGINESRITTEGRDQPLLPSEHPGGKIDLELLRAGDRRVDIVSSSPVLLAPVLISALQTDPMDSRIIFTNGGSKEYLKSWSLEVADENGKIQKFGPYTREVESISGNTILGNRQEGNYKVVMIGQTKDGNVIRKESALHLVRNADPKEEALRYSILFDFDKTKTVATYEKFITETIAPLVTDNSTVIIHGHSDIIGDPEHNMKLSQDRAIEARNILESALVKAGRTGIKYEVFGFGDDTGAAPFANGLPEERFYNRTVIIDIIPEKK
jgi:outer membrane protein OmpA-like peptidoglycan-associated protein